MSRNLIFRTGAFVLAVTALFGTLIFYEGLGSGFPVRAQTNARAIPPNAAEWRR